MKRSPVGSLAAVTRGSVVVPIGMLAGSLACALVSAQPATPRIGPETHYTGSADASGAVAIGTDHFVVADDEDDTLRIYRRQGGGAPVASVCVGDWRELQPSGKKKELDLEGAARLGDVVYWLGSHGNSKEGKITPGRRQLFATTITSANGTFKIALVGQPYRRLLEDLIEAPSLRDFRLAEAAAQGRAPKDKGGFNFEGLCATPDGHLLVGLRNPIPRGRALLVPITNPAGIIRGERARLGAPIELDLEGRGIRDLVLVGDEYFIIAGDYQSHGAPSQIYRWAGGAAVPRRIVALPMLNPEVLIAYPDTNRTQLQVLSDDGDKSAPAGAPRSFRSVVLQF